MVREVTHALLTLPFDLTGATARATRAHDGPPSPLFTLHLLRHHGRTIAQALEAVGRSPHRVLAREDLIRPVAQATRLDGAAVRWALTHPDSWAVTARAGGWFRHGGQAVLPVRLLQERAEETFDTDPLICAVKQRRIRHPQRERAVLLVPKTGNPPSPGERVYQEFIGRPGEGLPATRARETTRHRKGVRSWTRTPLGARPRP